MLNQQKIYCVEYLKSLVARLESSGDSLIASFQSEGVSFYLPWMREPSEVFAYHRQPDGRIGFENEHAIFSMFHHYPQWHPLLVSMVQLWKHGKSPTAENLHVMLHEVPFLLPAPWLHHAVDMLSKDPVFHVMAQQMKGLDEVERKAYFKGFARHMKSTTSNRLHTQVLALDYVMNQRSQKEDSVFLANESTLVARYRVEGKPVFFIYRAESDVVEPVAWSMVGTGSSLNAPEISQEAFLGGRILNTEHMEPMTEQLWRQWMQRSSLWPEKSLRSERGVGRYHQMLRAATPKVYAKQLDWLDSLLSIKNPQWASQVMSGLSGLSLADMHDESMLQFTA